MRNFRDRGFTLIELAIVVAIFGTILTAVHQFSMHIQERNYGKMAGSQLKEMLGSEVAYMSLNFDPLVNGTAVAGVANPYQPTFAELQALGFIAATVPATNEIGSTWQFDLSRQPVGCVPPACDLLATVTSTGPALYDGKINYTVLRSIAEEIGNDASYAENEDPTTIRGVNASWSIANPIAGQPAGVIMARAGFNSQGLAQFIRNGDSRAISLNGTLAVNGAGGVTSTQLATTQGITVGTTMDVLGASNLVGGVTVTGAGVTTNTLTSATSNTGATTTSTLNATGAATLNGVTNNGNLTNTGALSTNTLTATGASTLAGVTNTGNLTNTGLISTNTLAATGASTLASVTTTGLANTGNITNSGRVTTSQFTANALSTLNGVNNTGNITNSGRVTTATLTATGASTLAGVTTTGLANTGNITNSGALSTASLTSTSSALGNSTANTVTLLTAVASGTACSPNGKLATSADGGALVCVNGVWQSSSTKPCVHGTREFFVSGLIAIPDGCNSVTIEGVGGGGAGGQNCITNYNSTANRYLESSGGAAGVSKSLVVDGVSGHQLDISIGAGGVSTNNHPYWGNGVCATLAGGATTVADTTTGLNVFNAGGGGIGTIWWVTIPLAANGLPAIPEGVRAGQGASSIYGVGGLGGLKNSFTETVFVYALSNTFNNDGFVGNGLNGGLGSGGGGAGMEPGPLGMSAFGATYSTQRWTDYFWEISNSRPTKSGNGGSGYVRLTW